MRAKLGTDRPIYIQYVDWVWHMLQLDFGNSYHYHTPISKDLKEKFAVTLELTILAVLMASVVAVPLGVISAIKQDSFLEYVSRIITFSGIALPTFWVGILIIYFLVLIFECPPAGVRHVVGRPREERTATPFPLSGPGLYQRRLRRPPDPILDVGGNAGRLYPHRPVQGALGVHGD